MREYKSSDTNSFGSIVDQYRLEQNFSVSYRRLHAVREFRLSDLFDAYKDILWEDGRHKYNTAFFIGELDEILSGQHFSAFSPEMPDRLTVTLRQRGNSNATINRKMAALGKLLRKAHKMGDIHSLPEFRRQKEGAGRIRFLEPDEEDRLFASIHTRSEGAHRLSIFLVDTGCRLGEAIGLIWNDIQGRRVSFWLTKSGRSRSVPLTPFANRCSNRIGSRSRAPSPC